MPQPQERHLFKIFKGNMTLVKGNQKIKKLKVKLEQQIFKKSTPSKMALCSLVSTLSSCFKITAQIFHTPFLLLLQNYPAQQKSQSLHKKLNRHTKPYSQFFTKTRNGSSHKKGKEDHQLRQRKKNLKLPYDLGEDICCISLAQTQRAQNYGNRIKELKYLIIKKICSARHTISLEIFPSQKCANCNSNWVRDSAEQNMIEEAINIFKITPPIAITENQETINL